MEGITRMKYIVESITKDGIKTSSTPHLRFKHPKPGDLVDLLDDSEGMIDSDLGDKLMVCTGGRSVFMGRDHVSISGGPFITIKKIDLEPTYNLRRALFWTWARTPEADGGVEFMISRPVFKQIRQKENR